MRIILVSLMLGLVLTACIGGPSKQNKKKGCPPDAIVILNEDTGRYDCVNEEEYERILEELDETRW